jgi:hypothetical protein
MAFKEQKTSTTRGSNKGIEDFILKTIAYHDKVNAALDALPTTKAKILWLHKEGWSPKQMCDHVLRTARGTRTPEQHVNRVLQDYRAGK